MRYLLHLCCIAVASCLLTVPVLAGSTENVSVTTLPNGLKVIVREGHSVNLVAVDIWVKAGSINETPGNNGISHLVEHMIFKASAKYGPGEIDRAAEGVGAELNGGTSKDWVHFYTTVASEYLPVALDVLSDAVTNPRFDASDLEKERGVVLDEVARVESDPAQRALRLFAETAFTAHPYRLSPAGTRESLGKLTRQDLVDYYKAHYTPENMRIVIAGDVAKDEVLALVEQEFSGLKGRSSSESQIPAEPPQTDKRIRRVPVDSRQSYVVLGYHVPSVAEFKDVCALDVILAVLGDTYRGRLPAALTARGVQFTRIDVDFITQRDPTTFAIEVTADPSSADKVVAALASEFQRLAKEGISAGELEYGQRLVQGSDLFEQETFSGQARALGLYDCLSSYTQALSYSRIVKELTRQAVADAAHKYFGTGAYTAVVLGPPQATSETEADGGTE